MDDLRLPFASQKSTPSLCSNVALWEMDDIEASDPVMVPQITTPQAERCSLVGLVNTTPRSALDDTFSSPHWQSHLAGSPSTQPATSSLGHHWSFANSRPLSEASPRIRFRRRQSRPQKGAAGVHAYQWEEVTPTRSNSSAPSAPIPIASRRPISEMSFMDICPLGNATISYIDDNGEAQHIAGITVEVIERRCPLLAAAFELRSTGPQLHLEILKGSTVIPFLRFLYTGSYALICQSDGVYGEVPTSLLLHCQLYHLGAIYDIPGLVEQANVNIIRQCEFGCSSPDSPIHLCAAIEYAFSHMSDCTRVLDTIVNYCVACFLRHRLAEDEEFKRIAFELKPFHQALCQESMNRQFENETASAIIRMPFKRDVPDFYHSREDIDHLRLRDVVHHFHGSDDDNDSLKNVRSSTQNVKSEQHDTVHGEWPAKEQSAFPKRALSALKSLQEELKKFDIDDRILPAESEAGDVAESSSSALLHRARRQSQQLIETECSNGDSNIGPMEMLDMAADEASASDCDYENVSSPASVRSLDSGSDGSTLSPTALLIRGRIFGSADSPEHSSPPYNSPESSDSEWSLL
ncbi:uncharacterized protein RCC_02131 [Ramularia collo-cygni]|uniref:BTB domain-containing protein n=1 Tax=Ramularia collo-cygni TaxID=112498 RepID=A0A2D3V459_9PEZI|nr:uncharacterized protein RCC_02131 [Ramularia collo-cygni]CZT16289.1 uncharacterized protein RCC_02131 [Ramularia collo-cygni]